MSDEFFAGMRPVGPPDELRGQVLRAARSARTPHAVAERPGLGFTRFDLVWAAALVLLLVCHAGLGFRTRSAQRVARVANRSGSERIADKALAREVGIPGFGRIERQEPGRAAQPMTIEDVLRVGS